MAPEHKAALAAHARLASLPGRRHYSWIRDDVSVPLHARIGRPRGSRYGRSVRITAGRYQGAHGVIVGGNGNGRYRIMIDIDSKSGGRIVSPAAGCVELIDA